MHLVEKVRNVSRSLLQAYAPTRFKTRLWNTEFATGKWDCLEETREDGLYPYISKWANQGSVLDLGCGSGNTANELPADAYGKYVGIDISDVAISKATKRTEQNARLAKCSFFQGDISSYVPTQQFDLILFRDSMYYVSRNKVKSALVRFSRYLKPDGVFIVKLWGGGGGRCRFIVDAIEANFDVIEKDQSGHILLVFRPMAEPRLGNPGSL